MLILTCFTIILLYFLVSISLEDLRTLLISEKKLINFTISGLLYLFILGLSNEKINTLDLMLKSFFSIIIIFIIMFSIKFISYKVFGLNSLGIGDIKLSLISTIWLGIELSLISLCISFLISAIYGLYGKMTKNLMPFQQYPFAPFLSIGIFCCWIIDKI